MIPAVSDDWLTRTAGASPQDPPVDPIATPPATVHSSRSTPTTPRDAGFGAEELRADSMVRAKTRNRIEPTAVASSEQLTARLLILSRAVALIQFLGTSPLVFHYSKRPWLDLLVFVVVIGQSALLTNSLVRRNAGPTRPMAIQDLVVTTGGLVAISAFAGTAETSGLWPTWGLGIALHTAAVIGTAFPVRATFVAAVLPVGWILAHAGQLRGLDGAVTLATDSFGLLATAALAAQIAGRARANAQGADCERLLAAESARRDEFQRHRLLLHDQASLLNVLSTGHLPSALQCLAQAQAKVAVNTIRAFIDNPRERPADGPSSLDDLVHDVIQDFVDLPIVAVTSLAAAERISSGQAPAVRAALRTTLHNIRNHADAHQVVVHADHPSGTDTWELSIRDDGCGFDPSVTPLGFGLRVQVIDELERVGVTAQIHSTVGEGTHVVFSHLRQASPSTLLGDPTG